MKAEFPYGDAAQHKLATTACDFATIRRAPVMRNRSAARGSIFDHTAVGWLVATRCQFSGEHDADLVSVTRLISSRMARYVISRLIQSVNQAMLIGSPPSKRQ